jgi:DNA-binding transcriptional LysR family regulator
MRELETRLEVRLLARTTRSVAPTPAGERLLRSVEPALKQVETGLAALSDWRGVPSGTIKLTAFRFAAQTVLASALPRFLLDHPRVSVDIVIDGRLNDLVNDGYDAGIRFGEALERDMVAVRIGPDIRTVVVGSPVYFERHPRPQTPADLDLHSCVNYRFLGSGALIPWEFEREGKEVRIRPKGQLVLNDEELAVTTVIAGVGLGYMLEENALPHLAAGRLVQVLDEWCVPFPGLHLCYPSRQVTPALRALVDSLRWRAPQLPSFGAPALALRSAENADE